MWKHYLSINENPGPLVQIFLIWGEGGGRVGGDVYEVLVVGVRVRGGVGMRRANSTTTLLSSLHVATHLYCNINVNFRVYYKKFPWIFTLSGDAPPVEVFKTVCTSVTNICEQTLCTLYMYIVRTVYTWLLFRTYSTVAGLGNRTFFFGRIQIQIRLLILSPQKLHQF